MKVGYLALHIPPIASLLLQIQLYCIPKITEFQENLSNRSVTSVNVLYSVLTEVMAYSESGPRNLVILAGKETKILCNAGPWILGIDWYFVAVGGSEEIKLSTRSQISSAGKDFSVSGKIPGESLSINTTEIKHAGKYICTTLERQKNRSSADVARFITQVIVLGKFVFTLQIIVVFRGN